MTQKERLIKLLEERGEKGVYVYEIQAPRPKGLGIAQYNARIKELREGDNDSKKNYNIVSVEKGKFVLRDFNITPKKIVETPVLNLEELKARRLKLLDEYKKLVQDGRKETTDAKMILSRGKAIRNSIDMEITRRSLQKSIKQNLF